jgi:hypothetical protein
MQFEEYLLAMLASVKYKLYMEKNANKDNLLTDVEGDPASEFSNDWVHAWMQTENFRIWNKNTDSHLFDIVDAKHPCSGGLSIEDVQRRLAQYVFPFHTCILQKNAPTYPSLSQSIRQPHLPNHLSRSLCADPRVAIRQVAEMHLNERLEKSREAIGQQLAVGQQKVSSAYNRLWAEMEAMREAQKKRAEEQRLQAEKEGRTVEAGGKCMSRHYSILHALKR